MPERKGVRRRSHYKGIRCGNVVHCEGGYFACGEGGGGWAYDNDGKKIKQFFADGAGDHQQNFIDAVRSRKLDDLNADVRKGHVSSSLCHMGNISHRIGKTSSPEDIRDVLKSHRSMKDAFERFRAHLDANEIDISKEKATLGPLLTMDPETEEFIGAHADEANKLLTKAYRRPFVMEGAKTLG
jgi:hypothetical protein